jgi:hypothetical protein
VIAVTTTCCVDCRAVAVDGPMQNSVAKYNNGSSSLDECFQLKVVAVFATAQLRDDGCDP